MKIRIPKAYRRNSKTKLLWLYKNNIITYSNYCKCMQRINGGK